jgi:O-antigen/teichoic acid export membrane protein
MGLIAGAIFADIVATFNLVGTVWKDYARLRSEVNWGRIKKVAKEYVDFPLYSASQNVINALSMGLPVLLLTQYFGVVVAGSYAFGVRLLWAPMSLLMRALRQVLFQRACEIHHSGGSLVFLYIRVTFGLFILALFPAACFIAAAPWLFSLLFGPQWVTAGEYSQSLAIWCVFASCNLPAVIFARLIRIQRTVFLYDLGLLALRVASLILGGLYLSASSTVMTFAIVGAVMNLFLILLVGRELRKREVSVSLEGVFSSLLERKNDEAADRGANTRPESIE